MIIKNVLFAIMAVNLILAAFPAAADQSYDKVKESGILRCAYILYPSETEKDIKTGKLSGAVLEMTEEAAKLAGLKVEWVAEVGFETMFEGFKTGQYDALCSGLWETPARAREALFTIPTNYGMLFAYVRKKEARFEKGLKQINHPGVTIAVIDGEYGEIVASQQFPLARKYSLPQLSDMSSLLVAVETGKADVAFLQTSTADAYMKSNPGKLRKLGKTPIRAMPAPAIAVNPNDQPLKNLLDASFRFMQGNGKTEEILRKYDPSLTSHFLPTLPYTLPE